MYKEIIQENPYGISSKFIVRDNEDGSFTSFLADENNPNYQAYLAWLNEGNVPEPAEEQQ